MTDQPEPPVLVRVGGGLGSLTLNRPRVVNALDDDMVGRIRGALDAWEHDPDVDAVLIDGAGDRGFCAGGDVRGLAGDVSGGRIDDVARFFRAEYALNARIAAYPKPLVALADGITMGGGVGLAGHAAIRIVTERSQLAMPETRIGFTPDVGGTWLLGRAPGRLGEYLALTGATMDAADAIYAGFADHFVRAENLDGLRDALRAGATASTLSGLVRRFEEVPAPSKLERARAWIDDAFAADTVAGIVERLRAAGATRALGERERGEASASADELEMLSPTGLAVTLASVRRARELPDLRAVLEQEYALVLWFVATQPDLPEGIRAQVVDKDRTPHWQPATIADLSPDAAAIALAYVPETPLWA
ncbi:enoyl-CoA hydratase/isomerase family protein [Microbacterium sp.]|uniref:enoyl-CoA hydratase/isomerase family protein n=1 Tax=Microbacterium sp. TaxID=51671 RepID=UPI0025F9F4A8|nr:enoyl-CoA hydratase/isomerase family protein [Microbacterium sp.]